MIKVKRGDTPGSLETNASTWTNELLQQIKLNGTYKKVPRLYKDRYRQKDVKDELERMYGEKCCYCEVGIGISDYPHIEHRKPKSLPQFYNLTFQWNNLHWVCTQCNTAKGTQWDNQYPILDPTKDNPEHFLTFDTIKCEITPLSDPGRGKTTIEHTKLNRDRLVKARRRIRKMTITYIDRLKKTPSPEDEKVFKELLEQMITPDLPNGEKAEHSMFIKKIIEEYL